MADFELTKYTLGQIDFNAEEIKAELTEKVAFYKTLVYTDETARDAKNDRARLNALRTALDDERKRRKKEFMAPFEAFESKVKDIISVLDEPIGIIDAQLAEFEKKRAQEKAATIEAYFENKKENEAMPGWITITDIMDPKWLNASTAEKKWKAELDAKVDKIRQDVETIGSIGDFSFEAMEHYKKTLNLGESIAEGKRLADIQRRKEMEKAGGKICHDLVRGSMYDENGEIIAQQPQQMEFTIEEQKAPETAPQSATEPKTWWVNFRAKLTAEQARMLKAFFEANGIEYEAKAER